MSLSKEDALKLAPVSRQLYALRNGILADAVRKAGCPCKIIFGLNIAQLNAIATGLDADAELTRIMWSDRDSREMRLLALCSWPEQMRPASLDESLELAAGIQSAEEADMLCFRVLKYLPFAAELAYKLEQTDSQLMRYLSRSLRRHL